uniref:BED-type domain-containing protein n=1 Tax=Meloidogyne enterolobii TaxID=390850 RepID=A0A6V7VS98_MELEN|nr:unnamed protein product [Meloidogyne enterolobii]
MLTSPLSLIQQLIVNNGNKLMFNFYNQKQIIDLPPHSVANTAAVPAFGPFEGGQFSSAAKPNFLPNFTTETIGNFQVLSEKLVEKKEENNLEGKKRTQEEEEFLAFLESCYYNKQLNIEEEKVGKEIQQQQKQSLPISLFEQEKENTVQKQNLDSLKTTTEEKQKFISLTAHSKSNGNNNNKNSNPLPLHFNCVEVKQNKFISAIELNTKSSNNESGDNTAESGGGGSSPEEKGKEEEDIFDRQQISPSAIAAEVQRVSIDDNNKYIKEEEKQKTFKIISNENKQKLEMEKEEEKQQQQQKCNPIETQGIGRFEGRTGIRTLRKYPAVEEEEHSVLSLFEQQQQSSSSSEHSKFQSQQPQFTHQQTSSAISPPLSSFVPSPTAAALQLALLHHHHNQQQQHHQIPSPLAISIPGITETQPATNTRTTIKQECEEQINREELFSTLLQQQQLNQEQISANSCSPSWINTNLSVNTTQQQQQAVNVLANLIGHIQQQKQNLIEQQQQPLFIESQQQHQLNTSSSSTSSSISAPTSRLAAIQEEQINLQLQQQSIGDNIGEINNIFERNQSTESTASTSGVKLSITTNVEPIPRKQDIQTDIRMNRGRFKLVRKRGRSEVWNLFGQVVDTLTNARLPYVACYACKVLYTDTGGGTGNMTRHRCSMGSSYRNSVRRSSSDTTVGNDSLSFNQSSSSFESVGAQQHQRKVAAAAAAAALILEQQQQQQRVLIPQSGNFGNFSASHSGSSGCSNNSSGFQSLGSFCSSSSTTTSIEQQQHLTGLNLSSLPSVPAPTMLNKLFGGGGNNSSSSSSTTSASLISPITAAAVCMFQQQQQPLIQPMPVEIPRQSEEKQHQQTHFGLLSTISPEYDSAASAPSVGQGEIINYCGSTSSLTGQEDQLSNKKEELLTSSFSGHHFTSTDRQLFSQAVMNFCSQDLLKWEIVEGEGFQNLVETLIFIGRRSSTGISSSSTTIKQQFDPIKRQLIQTGNQMKKIFLSQEKAISQSTKNDLEQIKNVGISLNCHQIEFGGEKQLIISINYITDDWRITQRILKVQSLKELKTNYCNNQQHQQTTNNNNISNIYPLITITIEENIKIFDNEEEEEEEEKEIIKTKLLNNFSSKNITPNLFFNLKEELNNILIKCLNNQQLIIKLINLFIRIIEVLAKSDFGCGQFLELENLEKQIKQQTTKTKFDFTNIIYPSIKFIREHCSDILTFLEEEKIENEEEEGGGEKEGKLIYLKNLTFLEPFYETSQIFLDLNKPHFHKILPELFALIHECQQSTIKEEEKEEGIFCLSSVRLSATLYLKEWANKNICLEHRVATALNPRLRHLPLICSDSERLSVYEKIREMANLDKKPKESIKKEEHQQQPFCKRRRFLDQLEGCSLQEVKEEDELDCYLKATFTSSQTSDILEFWSSIGEEQFPRLAKLARFLLGISVAPLPLINKKGGINSGLNSEEIGILLNLRPNILNSVNHQLLSRYKQQQQQ